MFKVTLTKITEIKPHPDPNATKLELIFCYGFQIVGPKDRYKVGDTVVFIAPGSVLSPKVESIIFKNSKIQLNKSRVREIKIRGALSEGLIGDPQELGVDYLPLESNVAEILDIKKYEPPAPKYAGNPPGTKKLRNRVYENPYFRKYNGITNLKFAPRKFEGHEVVVQAKCHGSHVRFMKAPYHANTIWKKIKKFLGLTPKFENVYGSNNVEKSSELGREKKHYYGEDLWGKVLEEHDAFNKIKNGEAVHGEIYGPGIQANYHYGKTKPTLIIFDVRVMREDGTQKWLDPEEAEAFAKERGFDFVPVLYKGMFDLNKIVDLATGPDPIYPEHVREGCVVKLRYNYDKDGTKQNLKAINPEYLLDSSNTDFH